MSLTPDQQKVVDVTPSPQAGEGQTVQQAMSFAVQSVIYLCGLEGYGEPSEAHVLAAFEARASRSRQPPS